jgi:hypothetical protein
VTFPHAPQPGPPPGGFRPAPPPGGFRPAPAADAPARPGEQEAARHHEFTRDHDGRQSDDGASDRGGDENAAPAGGTGHPAVDAVLQSLANAARLAPADQIAEYEAAHRVLQETLSGIDG